ncbi:mediator complex subunit 17 isoform X2 [Oratosquilla oratoria]
MSEHLTQLARKVDFGATDGEDLSPEEKKEEEDEDEKQPFQQPHWPWDNVRNKIRSAWTEMCVLHDLLQIVREKRYMVLDPVQSDPPEQKLYVQFLSLKRSLNNAATILLSGAERLRTSQADMVRSARQVPDFHIELLRLRQNWRLKKFGNNIFGDLSYRSAGSQFRQTRIFEVSKADDIPTGPSSAIMSGAISPMSPVPNTRVQQSSLKVTVPTELEGVAYIFVCIRKDEEDLCSTQLSNVSVIPSTETHWQEKLEKAQNVLFCKELFMQLASEAVQLTPSIPHMVVGNQITATIFPGIQLLIGLCLSDGDEQQRKKQGSSPGAGSGGGVGGSGSGGMGVVGTGSMMQVPSKNSHDHVLEHSLHQLLHGKYQGTFQHDLPHPTYAPMGVSKKRRIAGPEGCDRSQILQTTKSEKILEQIIRQAQHNFLRLRTMYVIDQMAMELKDPLIVSHWNSFNSPTQSCVKINIITQGYDTVSRTTLVIHVYERSLKCICRDGRVMTMSFEPQELRNLIFCQISQHNMAASQSMAKYMGWTVLTADTNIGVGPVEPLGNASAVLLASPNGNKIMSIRSGPLTGITVAVLSSPRNDFYPSTVVSERKWENLGGPWQEVRLERVEGRNFLNKIELLMAALTA